jgi:hypothetical protein
LGNERLELQLLFPASTLANHRSGNPDHDLIGAAHAVERLHHFPAIGIDDDQPPRLVPVSAFDAAADEQAMMGRIQTRRMGRRAASDGPLGHHGAFFKIDDLHVAVAVHHISHGDVQPLRAASIATDVFMVLDLLNSISDFPTK